MGGRRLQGFEYYLGIGAFAGIMAGMLGVGGGIVIVPSLIWVFLSFGFALDYVPQLAIGTSLATILFTTLSATRVHHSASVVDWVVFNQMFFGLIAGVVIGAWVASYLSGVILQGLFGVFLFYAAWRMIQFRASSANNHSVKANPDIVKKDIEDNQSDGQMPMYAMGGVIGLVSSFFGIGGGTLTVPFLRSRQVPIRRAVGTSAACGIPIAVVGSISYMVAGWGRPDLPTGAVGYIYWPALLGVWLSSIIGAQVGAKLSHRMEAQWLSGIFALLLCVVAVKLIVSSIT